MNNPVASLRRRFPGYENRLRGRIQDLAAHENESAGIRPKRIHGWVDSRPENPTDTLDRIAETNWVAYLNARTVEGATYRVPVIPDEYNPRQDKMVKPEDKPHVFKTMPGAEKTAEAEPPGFLNHLEQALQALPIK